MPVFFNSFRKFIWYQDGILMRVFWVCRYKSNACYSFLGCDVLVSRIVIVVNLLCLIFFVSVPRADANPGVVAVAAGGIEIGGLAIWAGVSLLAAVGTAVGLDERMMDSLKDFGRDVWDTADTLVRDAITSSFCEMKLVWNTASTASVDVEGRATSFLKEKFEKFFERTYVDEKGIIVSAASPLTVLRPSSLMASNDFSDTTSHLGFFFLNVLNSRDTGRILSVNVDVSGLCTFTYSVYDVNGHRVNIVTDSFAGKYPNAQVAFDAIVKKFGVSFLHHRVVRGTFWSDVVQREKSFERVQTLPYDMFGKMSLPAPRVQVDGKGKVTFYQFPTVVRSKTKVRLDTQNKVVPYSDIAVGYPGSLRGILDPPVRVPGFVSAIPLLGSLAISTPLNPALNPILNPSLDGLVKDVALIRTEVGAITGSLDIASVPKSVEFDFGPLMVAGNAFTRKFPFSVPWDVKRQLDVFNVSPQAPKFVINKPNFIVLSGYSIPLRLTIDLAQFDFIASLIRWFGVIAFDIGVILAMRRFMPE